MKRLIYVLFFCTAGRHIVCTAGKVCILFHRRWNGSESGERYGDVPCRAGGRIGVKPLCLPHFRQVLWLQLSPPLIP